ncbi:MAG: hypothetical protein SVY10_16300, partial [Thermodesulfobacteriota bacterium]|nr:hypothetical protein [Thermodesulfobacteriota bacterium]
MNIENIHTGRNENKKISLFHSITYKHNGLPHFNAPLEKPPSESGSTYVVAVFDDSEKPLRSFHIQISESQKKADVSKPLQVIYEWTGRGFHVGCQIAEEVFFSVIPQEIGDLACM